ncbi:MAG: TolC family protein [Candidatus Brocadiia bacterium]
MACPPTAWPGLAWRAAALLGGLGLTACAPEPRDEARALRAEARAAREALDAAPAELPAEPSLEAYQRRAMAVNPGLEAAFQRCLAALERVPQATALPEPRLAYAYYVEEVQTRVGPQDHRVGVMQAFPWFGTLELRGEEALEGARAAWRRVEAARLALAYRVAEPYAELYYLGRAIAIARETAELLEYIESVARSRYRVNAAPFADVIRAQVELSTVEDRLRSLEDRREPIAARLNAALHRPARSPVPLPSALPRRRLDASDEEVLAALREASPELQALGHEVARGRAALALARKSRWPDLSLGLSTIVTGSAITDTPGSGRDAVMAEVGIELPIWRAKYAAQEREAEARLAAAEHTLAERRDALAAETQQALFDLRDAERKIALYRDSLLPRAEQALQATQTAYKGGKASLADLIDAQRVQLDFRLALHRALADRAQRLALLHKLVGRPLPTRQAPPPEKPREEKQEHQPQRPRE